MKNLFDQLRIWWSECFPSAVTPFPEQPEIPGRDALLLQLEELQAAQTRDSGTRRAEIETLSKDLAEAETRVETIRRQFTQECRGDWLAGLREGAELDHLRGLIAERAPITLSIFIEDLDDELNRLRQMEPTIVPNGADRNYLMKKTIRFQTNSTSIKRRTVALQAARERAIAMQTENVSVGDIISEMYRLRKSLPAIVDQETHGALAAAVLSR